MRTNVNSPLIYSYPLGVVVLLIASIVGCGDGRPKRVAVSGQVLIDGQPLKFGSVRFVPEAGRPSYGELDQSGHFVLTCYGEQDGVVLGTHRIEVAAGESLSPTKTKWHAPKKYANYANSPLTQQVTGPDSVVISLSWEGGKPFIETFDAGGDRPNFGKPAGK